MIELTTFRLVEGADEERFLADDAAVQTAFAYQQPGLVRRTTAHGDAGEWLVLTLWASAAAADAAARAASDSAEVGTMQPWIEPSSVLVRRYEALD